MAGKLIRCCGLSTLDREVVDFEPELVVSCVPPTSTTQTSARWLPAGCDDIYNAQLTSYQNALRNLLGAFVGEKTLIHCQHGLSRSAALALMLVYKHNPDDVRPWLEANPAVQPNPLLLLFADELLGADFDLMRRCRGRWKGYNL